MRKYFIDNIRWIAVLLLFPYHTARIFDCINPFYVKGVPSQAAANFVLGCTPWFMPILFAVAGISTRYALQKRSIKEYVKERFFKLLIPFIFGILLLIPIQTYFAEVFHNGYNGSFFNQYILFFSKPTDFSGYLGGFTPAHLWFIYYLFIISLVSLPAILLIKGKGMIWNHNQLLIIPMFLITMILSYVLDIGGKSIGEYFSLFMLGYFILAEEKIQNFTEENFIPFSISGAVLTVYTVINETALDKCPINRVIMALTSWICILAILGAGRRLLNFQNSFTRYMAKISFSLYLFHQTWIVLIGFYILQLPVSGAIQYTGILISSFIFSIFSYELCKRFKITRFIFGISQRQKYGKFKNAT